MKVNPEKEVPVWEDSENSRTAHDGCPEHWRNDLRRSNTNLNEMSIEVLIKHFEPFDLLGKKNNKNSKKKETGKRVQFKITPVREIFDARKRFKILDEFFR